VAVARLDHVPLAGPILEAVPRCDWTLDQAGPSSLDSGSPNRRLWNQPPAKVIREPSWGPLELCRGNSDRQSKDHGTDCLLTRSDRILPAVEVRGPMDSIKVGRVVPAIRSDQRSVIVGVVSDRLRTGVQNRDAVEVLRVLARSERAGSDVFPVL
jgi:hypothetical protein